MYEYRVYDPVTGRWMNRDPIGETSFTKFQLPFLKGFYLNENTANIYIFVDQNPISFFDVLGLYTKNIDCGRCKVCLERDNYASQIPTYHIHWSCGKNVKDCHDDTSESGTAKWPSLEGREGTTGVPNHIKKCIEDNQYFEKKKYSIDLPLVDLNMPDKKMDKACCEPTTIEIVEPVVEVAATAALTAVAVYVGYKIIKTCGGAVSGFIVGGPPGAVGGAMFMLVTP